MECLSLPQVRFVYYLVKTNYGIIWTEPWIVMFCRTVITFVFSQISVIDKAIFSVFPKNYFWSHWNGTLEQMCYSYMRTCKTKALPQSSKQINGTITITWQSYQNKIILKVKKYQFLVLTIAIFHFLHFMNKIWLLLETSRNIFLITLRNCKHHHTGRQQTTERHLPRESA